IDGKLLGLTAAAFGSLLTYALALCIFMGLLRLAGVEYTMPVTAIRPGNLLVFGILAILGIFFWNCFFAAVAVTISDPNSSSAATNVCVASGAVDLHPQPPPQLPGLGCQVRQVARAT